MRIASILAASGVIAWLFCTLWTLPVSRSLLLYVGWLGVITFLAFFVAQRIPQNEASYAIFYTVMLGPLVLFTGGTSIQFGLALGEDGLIGLGLFLCVAAYFVGIFRHYTPNNFASKVMLLQGFVFAAAGLLTLASAIPPCSALEFKLRLTFGLYWLAISAYSFAQSVGVVRSRALFHSIDSWFAGALCVAFLLPLTISLQGIQREAAPQHHRDEASLSELEHLEAL